MRKCFILLLLLFALFGFSSCFSLMKADRLVYAGSIGKKVDAAIIDSVQHIETQSER